MKIIKLCLIFALMSALLIGCSTGTQQSTIGKPQPSQTQPSGKLPTDKPSQEQPQEKPEKQPEKQPQDQSQDQDQHQDQDQGKK